MISPRILFIGDPTEAVKYVGIAKKFARSTFDAGIISKVWKISDGVSIRVANNIQSKVCKVWIEAVSGGGYQFYTTSPHPQWATWENPGTDFYPGGSGVYVPYPEIKMVDGKADFSQAQIKAYPTGSTVEAPPSVGGRELWKYWPTPSDLMGLNEIMQGKVLKVKNAWQVNGIPEGRYYHKVIQPKEIEKGLIKQPKHSIYHSFVQGGGQLHGCGAFQPISPKYFTDFKYDVEPARMTPGISKLNGKAPDTDWFGEAGIHNAISLQYGSRQFVILSATDGVWHCYPVAAGQDVEAYSAQYAAYGSQAYKASVIPDQAKSFTPAYPAWVCSPVSWRDVQKSAPSRVIFEPRCSWSFNSGGTQAIGVMVERKASEATYHKTVYYHAGVTSEMLERPIAPPILPQELETPPLQLDPSVQVLGSSDERGIFVDRRGYVELEFIVEITGPELGDFTFSVGVSRAGSPDEIEALGCGALVGIAYAAPLHWGIEETEAFGKPLTKSTYRTNDVVVDDILTTWIELYWHQDQVDLINMYDGEVTLNVPSKAKARFYKNYPGSHTELFCIPVSQSHGNGYTYTYDPDVLPDTPHPFVKNTNRSLKSMFPWETEGSASAELYYYSTRIIHLDLRTLSFYCETRLLRQRRDSNLPMPYIVHAAKKYCGVCVMGKVVDEYFAGCPDVSSAWVRGWVYEAGYADLDSQEELTPLDYQHHLRGIGHLSGIRFPSVLGGVGSVKQWANASVIASNAEYNMLFGIGAVDLDALEMAPTYPWWAIGPCGHMFGFALALSLVVKLVGSSFSYGINPEDPETTVDVSFNFTQSLDTIVSDTDGFLGRVYDLYATLSIVVDGGEPQRLTSQYSMNPFAAANPGMTKAMFISALNTPYMKQFLQSMVTFYENVQKKPEFTTDEFKVMLHGFFVQLPAGLPFINSFFVLSRGGGILRGFDRASGNYNSFTEFADLDYIKYIRDGYKVGNLELGNMYYNAAMLNYFVCDEMEFTDKVLVTPEGHISYCKKNFYELDKEFCVGRVYYDEDTFGGSTAGYGYFHDESPSLGKLPRFYCIEASSIASNPYNCTGSDFEWKSVDGLSWHYDKIKTKHIYVYNLAYQEVVEGRKLYLSSQEEYLEQYSEDDFKPDFKMFVYNNFQWFSPYKNDDGRSHTLQFFALPVEDYPHYESTQQWFQEDPRPQKTFLRLSPLFF